MSLTGEKLLFKEAHSEDIKVFYNMVIFLKNVYMYIKKIVFVLHRNISVDNTS